MATYTYRCMHCDNTQNQTSSMHSTVSPPCCVCGGLTRAVITSAPTVLNAVKERTNAEDDTLHTGQSCCALHQQLDI